MDQYREGKVKRTPNRGVKQTLKSCAYKRSEPRIVVRRAFCIMSLRVTGAGEAKGKDARSRSESESEHGAASRRRWTRNQVIYPWAG